MDDSTRFGDGMMRLGHAAGVPVYWHSTVIMIPALVGLSLVSRTDNVTLIAATLIITVCVIGSILLHEAGHVIAARRYGAPSYAIVIHGFGGFALVDAEAGTRFQRAKMYLAGPAMNLVLALCFYLLLESVKAVLVEAEVPLVRFPNARRDGDLITIPLKDLLLTEPASIERIFITSFKFLMNINLVMCFLNMFPCFPLDGGKIAQLLLKARLSEIMSNRIVGATGLVSAFLVLGLARLWGLGFVLIAFFMIIVSAQALWKGGEGI
jgi:Zn-dependent protease